MTRNAGNGNWIPCNPILYRFSPGLGTAYYVTPEGAVIRGVHDRDGQFGYMRHSWKECVR